MSRRVELLCAWSGAAFLVLYLAFFAGVARWLPPMPPSWAADHVAQVFHDHATRIRVGQVGAMVSSFVLMPLWALLSTYVAGVERRRGRFPTLAMLQLACAVVLQVFFVLCSMIWLIATFREGTPAGTVQLLNDAAWLMFVMVFPGYVVQMICIGGAALMDTASDPVLPRWAGWFHLWVGLAGCGGGLAVFFKQGPFAWNGTVGFWLPVAVFAAWLVVVTTLLHRAVVRGSV